MNSPSVDQTPEQPPTRGVGSSDSSAPVPSFDFKLGDRTYHLTRDTRRGNGWMIVARGDLVAYASCLHDGEIAALKQMVERLEAIEAKWASLPNSSGQPHPTEHDKTL